jgi:hypothetical protein
LAAAIFPFFIFAPFNLKLKNCKTLNTKIKIGIGIGAAAAVGFLVYKGISYKETAENINVSLLGIPKIHSIDLSGMKISVDFKVDNPAKQQVRVKIPSIRLYYKGKNVASTAINDRLYTVEPVSSGKISGIKIEASYLNLLSAAPGMISDFASKGASSITDNLGFDVIAEVNGIPLKVQKL